MKKLKRSSVNIANIRSYAYKIGKYLGDIQALKRAYETKSFKPVITRLSNRLKGKFFAKFF